VLRRVHLFAPLTEEVLTELTRIAAAMHCPAGRTLFMEGDPATGLFTALRGRVKISRMSRRGREQVVTVIQPGQYFNMVPIFDGRPCPANAQTLDECELLFFRTEELHAVMARHPALSLAMLHDLAGFTRMLVNLVDDLSLNSVQGRLARLLLQNDAVLLSQVEMAAQLGTVREMIGRSLRSFEALGLIHLEKGVVTILDEDGLRAQIEE